MFNSICNIIYIYLKQKPKLYEIILKPAMASIIMAVSIMISYNLLIYFNISNNIATIYLQ